MAQDQSPFLFGSKKDVERLNADFRISIPARNTSSKDDLLSVFVREGRFPSGFGRNWDALLDCLRDLTWIEGRKVVIVHEALPLMDSPHDRAAYLEILETAISDWKKPPSNVLPATRMKYVAHELLVFFPSDVREAVKYSLKRNRP